MRIVIAEDSAVIRAGLTEILTDRGHEVAAAVGDAEALKAAVAEHQPDVAIIDVRMPPDHTYTLGGRRGRRIRGAADRAQLVCPFGPDLRAVHRPLVADGGGRSLDDLPCGGPGYPDRKSTRLNSSHLGISYA